MKRLLILLALLALATATAQEQETSETFYVHGIADFWASGADPSIALTPPTEADATTTCTNCAGPDPYTFTAIGTAKHDYTAGAGDATAQVWVKSWNNGPAPGTEVQVDVSVNGAQVATGSAVEDVLVGAIVQFDIALTFDGTLISAGDEIQMDIHIFDSATGGYNPAAYGRGVSAEHPWNFVLPLSPPAPAPPATVLDDAFNFVNATSLDLVYEYAAEEYPTGAIQTWTYNWTNENPTGNITYGGNNTEGIAHFLVIDDFGDILLDANVSAPLDLNQSFEGIEGNWTVQVTFTDYVGTAYLNVQTDVETIEVIPGVPVAGAEEEFADGNVDESEDTPAAPIALALLGMAIVALRKRN